MRALVLAVFGWTSVVVANYRDVEVYPGNGDSAISFHGNWKTTSDNCGAAFVASTVGDGLAYSFQGAAVYVLGTVACGLQGLLSISVDGIYNTTIDRCNCDVTPSCRFPWLAKDGLDPNAIHTVYLTLIGPTLDQNPSGQVVAELRAIRYTTPIEPADGSSGMPEDGTSTITSMVGLPTTSAESADAPLPQLANLHLGKGATAGIIIAVVLFFLFALFICIWLRRRSNQRRRREQLQIRNSGTMPVMVSRAGSLASQGGRGTRYPTEHLSWSPAAERLEARQQQQAATAAAGGRRNSAGSIGSSFGRSSWGSRNSPRRRMDSIPEAPDREQDHSIPGALAAAAAAEGSRRIAAGERRSGGGFSWADGDSPSSSPEDEALAREKGESERVVYSAVGRRPAPPPPTRVAVPSATASGEHWNRGTSRGSTRHSAPQSPLRNSLVPADDEKGSAS